MGELTRALVKDCAVWRDPSFQRSSHVRHLRYAFKCWADELRRIGWCTADVSQAIQSCGRLEQRLNEHPEVETFQCNQEQIASICTAAEAFRDEHEMRQTLADKVDAAIEASITLFGSKAVVPWVPPPKPRHLMIGYRKPEPLYQPSSGWQPRWPGDTGDPFEPCMQLLQQCLHSSMLFHARCLEQLTAAYGAVRLAAKNARDIAYIRTQAANAGISVKEYQRLLDMFNKIDLDNTGNVNKCELMAAMKRDKDIAAFMQLSRARSKDGRRESFESVFNRIDNTGQGYITWEQFLVFFSSGRSLLGEPLPSTRPPSPKGTRASPRGTRAPTPRGRC